MLIDYQSLSTEAFEGVCRDFVIRHINEIESDIQLEEWVNKIRQQVLTGMLLIEFSEVDQSVTLKTKEQIQKVDQSF